MKRLLLTFISVLLINLNLFCQKNHKEYNEKFNKDNRDVLSLNAIAADREYYSNAILEYLIVKQIIEKTAVYSFGIPKYEQKYLWWIEKEKDKNKIDSIWNKKGKTLVKLFPDLNDSLIKSKSSNYVSRLKQIMLIDSLGVNTCEFALPQKLSDLSSGFQFKYYIFKGDNKAAFQAFGLVDSNISSEDLYVVIDYLQYQDYDCTALPKIRYAVGIRSEFKISELKLNKDNKEKNFLNLQQLAANVEFGHLKVDISMKTIGITGLDSRFNIPSNTSFNVQTYGEYTKIIDFIKNNLKDTDDTAKLSFSPQLVPVMDEYRTSIDDINLMTFKKLKEIEKKIIKEKKRNKDEKIFEKYTAIQNEIDTLKIDLLKKQSNSVINKNQQLSKIQNKTKDLEKYSKILDNSFNTNKQFEKIDRNNALYQIAYESFMKGDKKNALTQLEIINNEIPDFGESKKLISFLKDENINNDKSIQTDFQPYLSDENRAKLNTVSEKYNAAFSMLIQDKIDDAKKMFQDVYNEFPTYKNADEILKLLKEYKPENKKNLYNQIKSDYLWGLDKSIKDSFAQKANSLNK